MRAFVNLRGWIAVLCLAAALPVWAQKMAISVVLSDGTQVCRDVADALRTEVDRQRPGQIEWSVHVAPLLDVAAKPRLVVTVGSPALAAVMGMAKVGAGETAAPVLATLIPRLKYEREIARNEPSRPISAILLDQPAARQAALIRAALPQAHRVGILLGPESRQQSGSLRSALEAQEFSLTMESVGDHSVFSALQSVLETSDVLLAIADPQVYNNETAGAILTAGYRRKVPVAGFSPAYVKAGALLGLYATPTQVGRAAAEVVRAVLGGAALPAPASPREFTIEVNQAVARSLGLAINHDDIRKRVQAAERGP